MTDFHKKLDSGAKGIVAACYIVFFFTGLLLACGFYERAAGNRDIKLSDGSMRGLAVIWVASVVLGIGTVVYGYVMGPD